MAITTATSARTNNHAGLIWAIADLLRGDYKQSEYGRVILPLVVLRRLDCVLEPTQGPGPAPASQPSRAASRTSAPVLQAITGIEVYNTSPADPARRSSPTRPRSPATCGPGSRPSTPRPATSSRSSTSTPRSAGSTGRKLLYLVLVEGHRGRPPPRRRQQRRDGLPLRGARSAVLSELSNETAGEHFTPREVIRLMVDLLFIEDDDALRTPGHRAHHARPRLRHRRHALGRRRSTCAS